MPEEMSEKEVKEFQDLMNKFTDRYLKGVKPVMEDGVEGHATRVRAETCRWFIGFGATRKAPTGELGPVLLRALKDPKGKWLSRRVRAAGAGRRGRQRAARKVSVKIAQGLPGVGVFDGKPCAKAAIPILQWARANGWRGYLNSGWRSIPYSISLCFRICGRAMCPGRCAGANTNHVGKTKDRFAIDVGDYVKFGELMKRCPIGPRIYNALGARDPVHFSPSGR